MWRQIFGLILRVSCLSIAVMAVYWLISAFVDSWSQGDALPIPDMIADAIYAIAAVAGLRWADTLVRFTYRAQIKPGHCPTCGYDLRATPDRCPECGTLPAARNGASS